jgi:hypothetical protein
MNKCSEKQIVKYKPFTKEVIKQARDEYLKHSVTAPEQFNIAYSLSEGWSAEFHEDETCWNEGFTIWMSGEDVLNLFFSCDPDEVCLDGWRDEWNDE